MPKIFIPVIPDQDNHPITIWVNGAAKKIERGKETDVSEEVLTALKNSVHAEDVQEWPEPAKAKADEEGEG